jgi:hypothetical protein
MGIKYYIKAPVSKYIDKEGLEKKRYQQVGVVLETKKGDLMIKLEIVPFAALEEGALWGYLNTPEEVEASRNERKETQNKAVLDDDVPF